MIFGTCDERFSAVRDAFATNLAERGELGAAVTVMLDGEAVVDLWGGWANAARTEPWQADSLVPVWSLGKAMTALALLRLVDRGIVDLDAPAARYWPEFAQAGKAEIPVHMLLSHRVGLPAIAAPLPPGAHHDWELMASSLAAQEPWWEPGTRFGYHVHTYGHLAGELVRRVDGRSLGTFVREEIAEPLGVEFHIGFGPEHDAQMVEWLPYVAPPGEESMRPWLEVDPATLSGVDLGRFLAYRNPESLPNTGPNTRAWRAAEHPSTNGVSNARALGTIFGALARGGTASNGYRLLSPETIARANTIEADGEDAVLGRPNRFGLGFQLTIPGVRPFGRSPRAFGHYGNGAIVGFADPDSRLALGYVCNQSGRSWRDPRNIALIDAAYASLEAME